MQRIGLALQTMYADLQQRCLDAAFDADFPENGSFYQQEKKGRRYWYYSGYDSGGRKYTKYVGPVDDPAVTCRVSRFGQLKNSFRERRASVRALVAGDLPVTNPFTGSVLDALARAGLFRLRACLVGTVAFQTYAGLLGVKLPDAQLMTGDADLAQFLSISTEVADSVPAMIEVLRSVDKTFAEISSLSDDRKAIAYKNADGYKVEFLVPNRGSDVYAAQPPIMPALGGAAAQPLRFLDFLIWQPVRAVLLHNAGIAVNVPAPERYAVHKLIVATRRRQENIVKINKDLSQAGTLIEAMATDRHHHLLDAWGEGWQRGDAWRAALRQGRGMLPAPIREQLHDAIRRACAESGENPAALGVGDADQHR
ncbi:MAG: GSU2403 family nucleotidyltransferase fold protein [Rhodospirillaceae bacterium]